MYTVASERTVNNLFDKTMKPPVQVFSMTKQSLVSYDFETSGNQP